MVADIFGKRDSSKIIRKLAANKLSIMTLKFKMTLIFSPPD